MQSYDRYSPDETLGIIASPDSNAIFDSTGKLAFTGAVQGVNVWNLRQASLTKTLKYDDINYPYSDFGEVISLLRLPDRTSIAAGYTSGEVRIFNYIQGTLTTTFRGHRSAVTSLAVDEKSDGSLLATGGADCDIIIWDLISLSGVARFHDHKDAVTGLAFLNRGDQKLLLSSSKDTLLKVWDLDSRCCIQTIVGHRAEIWSIAVLHGSLGETSKMRVFTGAADELIRVYKVNDASSSSSGKKRSHDTASANTIEDEEVLTYFGALERSSGADRCSSLSINVSNNLLGAQSTGKYVDIFRLRDATEAKKKMKRRIKRSQNKANNNDENSDNETTHADQEILIVDEIELVTTMKLASKVRSFSFNPMSFTAQEDLALVAYVNNSLEIHKIPHSIDKGVPMKLSLIDLPGHRSDVRSIAISPEHHTVVTSSSEALKLWTTRGLQCTGSCYSDGSYCLSVGFVPGGRHVLCGTKDGKLKVFDFASGDCVVTVDDAHPNAAIWAIAVRPDGRGFVTASADKTVKFWNFNLASDKLSVDLDRQLVLPADVLTVRFNHTKHQSQLLLAVGLLDNTVRIFYDDSLKLFLTLYGHKLPVMCVDMSYDHRLLVSGSADKTVKIWGLDFGDCHRSLFGHSDSVTAVRFVNNTHYFFSASKDGTIRYWDADRFEQILLLTGHKGAVWSLDVSNNGRHLFSSGQDRSIRVWTRTDDLVFIEEEKERMLESQADKAATADTNQQIVTYDRENGGGLFSGANKSQTMIASMSSIDSIRSGESLMAAIDLVEETLTSVKEKYRQTVDKDPTILTKDEKARKEIYEKIEKEICQVNPMFLQLTSFPYLQRNLRQIKLPDLEPALLLLPFHYIKRFFPLITELLRRGYDLELNSRIVLFLLTIHSNQIIATKAFMKELLELQDLLFQNLFAYRNLIGMNQMGFWFMTQQIQRGNEDVQAVTEVSKGGSGGLPAGLITSLTPEMGINADKIAHLDGSNFSQSTASHQNHQTVKAVEQRSAKKAKLV